MSALDWIISIGITILAYFVPYIIFLACHKEPISQEKAKKFTIIWAIISFLLVFAFKLLIIYFGGNTSSGMNIFAVFVWNGLGYFILINSSKKRIADGEEKQLTEHKLQHTCDIPHKTKKTSKFRITTICLVVSVIANLVLVPTAIYYNNKYNSVSAKYQEMIDYVANNYIQENQSNKTEVTTSSNSKSNSNEEFDWDSLLEKAKENDYDYKASKEALQAIDDFDNKQ